MAESGMEDCEKMGLRYLEEHGEKEDAYLRAGASVAKGSGLRNYLKEGERMAPICRRILYALMGGSLDEENPDADEFLAIAMRIARKYGKDAPEIIPYIERTLGERIDAYRAILEEGRAAAEEINLARELDGLMPEELEELHLIIGESRLGHVKSREAIARVTPIIRNHGWGVGEVMFMSNAMTRKGDK